MNEEQDDRSLARHYPGLPVEPGDHLSLLQARATAIEDRLNTELVAAYARIAALSGQVEALDIALRACRPATLQDLVSLYLVVVNELQTSGFSVETSGALMLTHPSDLLAFLRGVVKP